MGLQTASPRGRSKYRNERVLEFHVSTAQFGIEWKIGPPVEENSRPDRFYKKTARDLSLVILNKFARHHLKVRKIKSGIGP